MSYSSVLTWMRMNLSIVFIWSLLAPHGPHTAAAISTESCLSASAPLGVTCQEIASAVSPASSVFYPETPEYMQDNTHYFLTSNNVSACSFEPGTPEDVGIALQILGRTNSPYAIKSGGHTVNPGFSSTCGVQISLKRFSNMAYDDTTQTVELGPALVWDDVYAALEPYGVSVVGGRSAGVGVGGVLLGGGYSWHTNQYGLAIDMVEAFELVLPNGTVIDVDASQPDLFFGLKGGFNNFGIVTKFTLKTIPQTQVWGGYLFFTGLQLDEFTRAVANFAATNTDPKANIIAIYGYIQLADIGVPLELAILFYDAPSPPPGLFDEFLDMSFNTGVSTQSLASFVRAYHTFEFEGLRGGSNTVSIPEYSEDILQFISNEALYWGSKLPLGLFGYTFYTVEPFLSNIYTHNSTPTAWPGSRSFFSPFNPWFTWTGDGSTDEEIFAGLKQSTERIREKVQACAAVPEQLSLYGNYAVVGTPSEDIYGENLERLTSLAMEVDPENVMGLTGGFKF